MRSFRRRFGGSVKLLPWFGIALCAACIGAYAQGTVAAGASAIPDMQPGKWKLRVTNKGRAKDNEICGDPIDGFRREVQEYSASTKWGCTMTTNARGPRDVTVVYDCPSDRSPDGRPVSKGRSELSLDSASPRAFRLEMKSTVHPGYLMEGTRIGDCEK